MPQSEVEVFADYASDFAEGFGPSQVDALGSGSSRPGSKGTVLLPGSKFVPATIEDVVAIDTVGGRLEIGAGGMTESFHRLLEVLDRVAEQHLGAEEAAGLRGEEVRDIARLTMDQMFETVTLEDYQVMALALNLVDLAKCLAPRSRNRGSGSGVFARGWSGLVGWFKGFAGGSRREWRSTVLGFGVVGVLLSGALLSRVVPAHTVARGSGPVVRVSAHDARMARIQELENWLAKNRPGGTGSSKTGSSTTGSSKAGR